MWLWERDQGGYGPYFSIELLNKCVCVWVCVCDCERETREDMDHTLVLNCWISVCVCVSVCMWLWERDQGGYGPYFSIELLNKCVCVWVCVCDCERETREDMDRTIVLNCSMRECINYALLCVSKCMWGGWGGGVSCSVLPDWLLYPNEAVHACLLWKREMEMSGQFVHGLKVYLR